MEPISSNDLALRNSYIVELMTAARMMRGDSSSSKTIRLSPQAHSSTSFNSLCTQPENSLVPFSIEQETRNKQASSDSATMRSMVCNELARTATSFSVEQESRRVQLQANESAVPARESSLRIDKIMSLVHDLDAVADTFADVLNPETKTFSRDPRQDRVMPSLPTEEQRIIAASDVVKPLVFSSHMARVQEGVMVINNVSIAVDPRTDSFADVLSRISGSDAQVHAHFNPRQNKVVIESLLNEMVNITQDTSNFLEEVNIRLGNFAGTTDLIDGASVIDLIT